jgi:pantoate--beta-alanine ligase
VRLLHEIAPFSALLDAERADRRTIGLVPTMGALHDGHGSLVRRAAAECDIVAVTVFVNPLQFAPTEDLGAYPRTLDDDVELVERCGGSIVLAPSTEEMYGPDGTATTVSVSGPLTATMEGASRPTHFDGVATVVAKLFAMTGRCRAYFGEKDFQQLAVVRRMARDLSFPVEVVGCPTVREPDGLAMSSRNRYLTPEERAAAPVLHRALHAGRVVIEAGERDPAAVREVMGSVLATEPLVQPDYAEVVDAASLGTAEPLAGELRLLVAARLPSARLIDNLGVIA